MQETGSDNSDRRAQGSTQQLRTCCCLQSHLGAGTDMAPVLDSCTQQPPPMGNIVCTARVGLQSG